MTGTWIDPTWPEAGPLATVLLDGDHRPYRYEYASLKLIQAAGRDRTLPTMRYCAKCAGPLDPVLTKLGRTTHGE